MQANELITEFRLHVDDTDDVDEDRLWTDAELLSYLNQAINEFCTETEILIDSSNTLTQLAVTADNPLISYDDRILRFERICHDTATNNILDIVSILNVQHETGINDYGINFSSAKWLTAEGTPRLLISDMETQKLRAYPIPTADTTIATTVRRLPLLEFTQTMIDDGDSPEIPPRFHRKLLSYIKMMAYGKEDGETYDQANTIKYAAIWEKDLMDARTRIERERGKRSRVTRYHDVGAPVRSRYSNVRARGY